MAQTSWQTQLDLAIRIVDSLLKDKKELAEKHLEVSEDYGKAIDSWEAAKQDIYHFSGLWTEKTRRWQE